MTATELHDRVLIVEEWSILPDIQGLGNRTDVVSKLDSIACIHILVIIMISMQSHK